MKSDVLLRHDEATKQSKNNVSNVEFPEFPAAEQRRESIPTRVSNSSRLTRFRNERRKSVATLIKKNKIKINNSPRLEDASRIFSRIFPRFRTNFPSIPFVPSCPFGVTKVWQFRQKIRGKIFARPTRESLKLWLLAGAAVGRGFGCRSRIVSKPASFAYFSLKKKRTPFRDYWEGRKKRRREKDGLTVLFYLRVTPSSVARERKIRPFSNISHYFSCIRPFFFFLRRG